MTPDSELLAAFARTNSEDAFGELVRRHVNLVYSAALRQVNGDAHLAQDVAQTVFTDLARKAGSLARRESLTGWLYTSAHFAAAKIIRGENRRRDREEQFMRETEGSGTGVPPIQSANELAEWESLRPTLDDAMHELKEADREAILLRYFENRQFAEVGAKLGLNENAARMRVDRALEKLRDIFTKRGITTATALASVISANAVQLAPAGLAAALTTTSIVTAGTGTFILMKILTATKLKLGFSALVVAAAATAFVIQNQAQENLRMDNAVLTQQLAQLQTDNQSLSNRLATIDDSKMLSDDQFNELLKLRGEVGVLRNEENNLNQDNEALKRRLARISNSETNLASAPPQVHIKSRFITVPKDGFATPATAGNGLTGILSHQNFTNLFAMLKKREGVEILGEPEVTTISGRQTQARATQIISVITNSTLVESNGTTAIIPQTCPVETGPMIDVSPQVLSDAHTISLSATASVTDFLGYDSTTNTVPSYTRSGQEVDLPQSSPKFRVQESTAKVNLRDDQTLVLKLTDKQIANNSTLQSSSDAKSKNFSTETLVFVTVTIVDYIGNRKYKPEETDSIPDQPDSTAN